MNIDIEAAKKIQELEAIVKQLQDLLELSQDEVKRQDQELYVYRRNFAA